MNFYQGVVGKAKAACSQSGMDVHDHFRDVTKMITAGKGAERERADVYLTRYACYLIAMNGDPAKPEVATAQTYFAVQTRKQELAEAKALLEHRVNLRHRLTVAVNELNRTIKEAGVESYSLFHDAGYRGLYSMGLADIKERKGLSDKDTLFDRAGRAELAANEFHKTQTEQKIMREQIKGQQPLMRAHKEIGEEVRETIRKIGGVMPEDMQPEPSLKQLTSQEKTCRQPTG